MDNRPFRIQIAQRLRLLFGLGGIAIDDFVFVNVRASQVVPSRKCDFS
jgi:hypothetical protein